MRIQLTGPPTELASLCDSSLNFLEAPQLFLKMPVEALGPRVNLSQLLYMGVQA